MTSSSAPVPGGTGYTMDDVLRALEERPSTVSEQHEVPLVDPSNPLVNGIQPDSISCVAAGLPFRGEDGFDVVYVLMTLLTTHGTQSYVFDRRAALDIAQTLTKVVDAIPSIVIADASTKVR